MKQTIAISNDQLIKGAKGLIETMETPARFLAFLNDMLYLMHKAVAEEAKTPYKSNDDYYFDLSLLIENVVIPWYSGGADVEQKIADGFKKIVEFAGPDGYYKTVQAVFAAWSKNCIDAGMPQETGLSIDIPGLDALRDLIYYFREYDKNEEAA